MLVPAQAVYSECGKQTNTSTSRAILAKPRLINEPGRVRAPRPKILIPHLVSFSGAVLIRTAPNPDPDSPPPYPWETKGKVALITEETNPQNYLKLIASGNVDETMLEALEDFVSDRKSA